MAWYDILDTDLGPLFIGGSEEGVHRINFLSGRHTLREEVACLEADSGEPVTQDADAAGPAVDALAAWFADGGEDPDLPLAPRGTEFQRRVWEELRRISYGETISYGELARRIGMPAASRAVGAANGRNPLAIVVPCHRVIGADGTLTGYGGGLPAKQALLSLERRVAGKATLLQY